ncbi:cobalamin B12-binding domain-containing protein [Magnetococcus sp. PR-3]|uniref:cobalamin B12-binding domain-containing protein n=1 Tax=Magnetococcus sp. PR-3 TaxID=3120355 RepID=UPI002FCE2477
MVTQSFPQRTDNEAQFQRLRQHIPLLAMDVLQTFSQDHQMYSQAAENGFQLENEIREHLRQLFLALVLEVDDIFQAYLRWCLIRYERLGFPSDELSLHLQGMDQVIKEVVSEPVYHKLVVLLNLRLHCLVSDNPEQSYIQPNNPYLADAQDYLQHLLSFKRVRAIEQLVDRVLKDGVHPQEIYFHVLMPVQQEVGRLWMINQLSVSMEHFCSTTTRAVMSRLHGLVEPAPHHGGSLLAACTIREQHEIGLRMVHDLFYWQGWRSCYLGSDISTENIHNLLAHFQPDLLALSATMSHHLLPLRDLIRTLRENHETAHIKVLVGGGLFTFFPPLRQQLGADFCAASPEEALVKANEWINRR